MLERPAGQHPIRSRLLAQLPREDYQRLLPALEGVSLSFGQVIHEPGERLEHIYFPTSSAVALLYTTESGMTAEVGFVGNEGAVGLALFMGGDTTSDRAVVQVAGDALRLRAKTLREEFAKGGEFQRLLLRYTQALITQISQTAVCNRLHSVEQQLCRWLLLTRDAVESDELIMTQEIIANMLGVRREGVTVAAGRLQDKGIISYARGRIRVLDRRRLEETACECYQAVKDEFSRLLL